MEASTENNFTTEPQPSGSSVDWYGALLSSEFRAGLAEFVANTVTKDERFDISVAVGITCRSGSSRECYAGNR